MPKLVFRYATDRGVKPFPRPVEPRTRPVGHSNLLSIAEWCKEQGISDRLISKIEVTEFDNGSLIAYLTRYERGSNGRVMMRDGRVQEYVEHHMVTSIQLLLDQLAMTDAEINMQVARMESWVREVASA